MGNPHGLGDAREAFTEEILPKEVFGEVASEKCALCTEQRELYGCGTNQHRKLRQHVVMEGNVLERP